MTNDDRRRRYHYAFAPRKVKGGYKVSHVLDYASRGQADIASLRLLVEHGDAGSITLERELINGEKQGAARDPDGHKGRIWPGSTPSAFRVSTFSGARAVTI